MKVKDFEKLRRMMTLTVSENDHEVLAAIRAANKVLADNGVDWDRVFRRLVSVDVENAPDEPLEAAEKGHLETAIVDAFEEVNRKGVSGDFANFMASLESQWAEKHYLTTAQRAALFKAAERARSR